MRRLPASLFPVAALLLLACTESDEERVNATIHIARPLGIAYLIRYVEGTPSCAATLQKTGAAGAPALETVILDSVPHLDSLTPGERRARTLIGHKNTLLQADVTIRENTASRLRGTYRLFAEDSVGGVDTLLAPRRFIALKCPDFTPATV